MLRYATLDEQFQGKTTFHPNPPNPHGALDSPRSSFPCSPPTPKTSSQYCTPVHVTQFGEAPISSFRNLAEVHFVAGIGAVAMARSGVVLLSPPLVLPVASTSASSLRDCCSCASNAGIIRDASMTRSFAVKRVAVRFRSSESQRWRPSRASVEEDSNAVSQLNSSEVFGCVIT